MDECLYEYLPAPLKKIGHGICLASREVRNADWLQPNLIAHKVPRELQNDLLVFDWWVKNGDRYYGNPNLLWVSNEERLAVIDHNLTFDPELTEQSFFEHHIFSQAKDRVFGDLAYIAEYCDKIALAMSEFQPAVDERVKMVNTLDQVEDGLFDRFVMHDFAKAPDYEGELQRKIGQMLREINLEHKFKKRTLGTDAYKVTFPLVQEKEARYRAIQPLFFNQSKPQAIIEHSNRWAGKFDTLKFFGALPKYMLIPVKKPLKKSKDFNLAWELVEKKLKNFGDLVQAGDNSSIKAFAKF